MLQTFAVYFRYKNPNDKAPGPVRHFRINAATAEEARKLVSQYSRYPNLEVISIRPI
jgi:hypothetical protein